MDTNKIFIDMAQRAHEFAEMCERMANEAKQKADPEAWREEYRKKQAAGVRFECRCHGDWCKGAMQHTFECNKEDYREVPQDVSASECQKALEHLAKTYSADKGTAQLNPTIPPHAAERALWKAQREAGTNEVWQEIYEIGTVITTYPVDKEPAWDPNFTYRVKPMKLTAKIARREVYKTPYDWEFFGTREEYRAECEKYGYVVISEIKWIPAVKCSKNEREVEA